LPHPHRKEPHHKKRQCISRNFILRVFARCYSGSCSLEAHQLLRLALRKKLKNRPSLVDITGVNQLATSWAVSAATLTLFSLSAWHNRRNGYRRKRADESGIEEALGWLMELRASLSPHDDAAIPAAAEPFSTGKLPNAVPLLRLNAALQRDAGMKPAAAEPSVPSDLPAEIRIFK